MTGRPQILPNSPAHDGRQHWRCLTRKVVTAWAPFYASVDFDHEANPVRVHISQPGKKMGTEFGDVIDAIGEAATHVVRGYGLWSFVPPIMVERAGLGSKPIEGVTLQWSGREGDLAVQDMLRHIEGAISGLIQEARAT